jgi:hypothetical protein
MPQSRVTTAIIGGPNQVKFVAPVFGHPLNNTQCSLNTMHGE